MTTKEQLLQGERDAKSLQAMLANERSLLVEIANLKAEVVRLKAIHVTPKCEHDFQGWREFDDGCGGETVCTKCGTGAMSHSLRTGL